MTVLPFGSLLCDQTNSGVSSLECVPSAGEMRIGVVGAVVSPGLTVVVVEGTAAVAEEVAYWGSVVAWAVEGRSEKGEVKRENTKILINSERDLGIHSSISKANLLSPKPFSKTKASMTD